MDVTFEDENDIKNDKETLEDVMKKDISPEEKEHIILDIIHKLFVIAAFHNHHKQVQGKAERKEKAIKPKVLRGALS